MVYLYRSHTFFERYPVAETNKARKRMLVTRQGVGNAENSTCDDLETTSKQVVARLAVGALKLIIA